MASLGTVPFRDKLARSVACAFGTADLDAGCPVWNVEMRALKIAGAAIGAVIVVLALLLVIGIPSSFLTSQIQERVRSVLN